MIKKILWIPFILGFIALLIGFMIEPYAKASESIFFWIYVICWLAGIIMLLIYGITKK